MWTLSGAELTAPMSLLVQGGDNTLVTAPCPSFLIEHPKGLVLFDTGCNPKIIDDAVGYWGEVAAHLPLKWSKTENVKWKTPLADAGNSTPVIWGDKIFLTQANKGGSVPGS